MEMVTRYRIDPKDIHDRIQQEMSGSVVLHIGVVREKSGDRTTTFMEFEQAGDVEGEMRRICDTIRQEGGIEDVLVLRRLGRLQVGDVISVVAVSAPRREAAFDACRYAVDSFKRMKTIRKTEG